MQAQSHEATHNVYYVKLMKFIYLTTKYSKGYNWKIIDRDLPEPELMIQALLRTQPQIPYLIRRFRATWHPLL